MDLLKELQEKASVKSDIKVDEDITESFYHSKEWRAVRPQVLARDKRECQV